jgi:predicted transcriptional regulator
MARKQSPTLTDAELRLMKILWEHGPSTVGSVVETLPDDEPLAYSTVLTTLRILEQKGYLRHEKQGRAYVYHPVVDRGEARRSALRYVMDRFFNNSPELLVLGLLENEDMDRADLERLKNILEESD